MEKSKLLFYTSATGVWYLPFVPLYVYFCHLSNPDAIFEFIVDDINKAEHFLYDTLEFLRWECGIKIIFREREFYKDKVPMENTLRFVVKPSQNAEFVYIGDVDIIIVEDVMKVHKPVFDAGLPYSNKIRINTKKLTGLHFTRYDTYFPLPEVSDILELTQNDEEVLYLIVERLGHLKRQPEVDAVGVGRPQHGIHMSLNRIPFSDWNIRVDWDITWNYIISMEKMLIGDLFDRFVKTLPCESRLYLANVKYLQRGIISEGREMFEYFNERR